MDTLIFLFWHGMQKTRWWSRVTSQGQAAVLQGAPRPPPELHPGRFAGARPEHLQRPQCDAPSSGIRGTAAVTSLLAAHLARAGAPLNVSSYSSPTTCIFTIGPTTVSRSRLSRRRCSRWASPSLLLCR
jgi:hypothetical protein